MRIVELSTVLGIAASSFAGTMWSSDSIEGNFNTASDASGLLKNQTGWVAYAGTGPAIANGKAELYGKAREGACHAIEDRGSFKANAKEIDIGFTLVINSLVATANDPATQLLQVDLWTNYSITIRASSSADGKGINLSMDYYGSYADGVLFVPLNTPTRFQLTMRNLVSPNNVYLSQVSDSSGTPTAGTSALTVSGVTAASPINLRIFTTPTFKGGIDDLMVGNTKSEVYVQAHAPEPATAMMALPLAAGLWVRRKKS